MEKKKRKARIRGSGEELRGFLKRKKGKRK